MELDTNQVAQAAIDAISERINNLNMLNIIVAGKTGVGKSTLINAVFKEKLAKTGIGRPVTEHMRRITKKGVPLTIYDTRGFELGREVQNEVRQEVINTINYGLSKHDINEAIRCIWYCINTASNRVEPEEIEWIRQLTRDNQMLKVPVIIVLTQSFSKKNAEALRTMLINENLNVVQVVPVLAEDYEIGDEYVAKAFGLEELIKVMGELLPDELIDTLQNVQIACLAEKKKRAHSAVVKATTAAASECVAPIPFADSIALVPTQIAMIASITAIFGFDVNKSVLAAFLSATIGTGGATILGKTVVSNLLKMIPGAGSVAGAAISAGTASVITAALGEAYISIMSMVYNGEMSMDDLTSKEGRTRMTRLFKDELTGNQDK